MADERAASTVVVFTGGDPVRRDVRRSRARWSVRDRRRLRIAHRVGTRAARDLVVGDLDSVSAEALAAAVSAGSLIERHPVEKDATDLELALDRAADMDPEHIVVIGGDGGRLDHFLANSLLLGHDRYRGSRLSAYMGDAHLFVVRDHLALHGAVGEVVTLLPLHGPAIGVTTDGLRYPLRGETLDPSSTRGVSNEFVEIEATVRLDAGVLLAITPHQ